MKSPESQDSIVEPLAKIIVSSSRMSHFKPIRMLLISELQTRLTYKIYKCTIILAGTNFDEVNNLDCMEYTLEHCAQHVSRPTGSRRIKWLNYWFSESEL